MRRNILTILAAFIIPSCAFGFWSVYEVGLDGLRERPWIIVVAASTNEPTANFEVVFDHPDEYLFLELHDENDALLSRAALRGEAIRHGMIEEAAIALGIAPLWKEGTATVYRFTVSSGLLKNARLSWQFVPPHDELGNASTGGAVEWCHLPTLAAANRNVHKNLQPAPR
jgi:hypothetical protein